MQYSFMQWFVVIHFKDIQVFKVSEFIVQLYRLTIWSIYCLPNVFLVCSVHIRKSLWNPGTTMNPPSSTLLSARLINPCTWTCIDRKWLSTNKNFTSTLTINTHRQRHYGKFMLPSYPHIVQGGCSLQNIHLNTDKWVNPGSTHSLHREVVCTPKDSSVPTGGSGSEHVGIVFYHTSKMSEPFCIDF